MDAQTVQPAFFFKVPDDLEFLMRLRPAELRVYLVVQRAIQRDRRRGEVSVRMVAKRAGLSPFHAGKALASLCDAGHLAAVKVDGKTTVYTYPPGLRWATKSDCTPTGAQGRAPTGAQGCAPTGAQHLELSEFSKRREASATVSTEETPARSPWTEESKLIARCIQPHGEAIGKEVDSDLCNYIAQTANRKLPPPQGARAAAALIDKTIRQRFSDNLPGNRRQPWPASLGFWVKVVEEDLGKDFSERAKTRSEKYVRPHFDSSGDSESQLQDGGQKTPVKLYALDPEPESNREGGGLARAESFLGKFAGIIEPAA
jgi:hypothetical protein